MNEEPRREKRTRHQILLMILRRLVFLVVLGFVIGWLIQRTDRALAKSSEPAGFMRGLAQGAMMPIALPNLAVGSDVNIYAANNTGRTYKLGYTIGVNACGLIFFGFLFWRVRRMMKQRMGRS